MALYDDVCISCRAGHHFACTVLLAEDLDEGITCCCSGRYDVREHMLHQTLEYEAKVTEIRGLYQDGGGDGGAATAAKGQKKGDPGYVHIDAWLGTADIGTLSDPESTGRKRVDRMYPIKTGYMCEWANQKNCGGGAHPIIGCLGNAATELHHGPDKNTLNNEKASRGIGVAENVHVICSFCHNRWHAANDPAYPAYDRIADQASPWLPVDYPWGMHEPIEASSDELLEEEARRRADPRYTARAGRNGNTVLAGDLSIEEE